MQIQSVPFTNRTSTRRHKTLGRKFVMLGLGQDAGTVDQIPVTAIWEFRHCLVTPMCQTISRVSNADLLGFRDINIFLILADTLPVDKSNPSSGICPRRDVISVAFMEH